MSYLQNIQLKRLQKPANAEGGEAGGPGAPAKTDTGAATGGNNTNTGSSTQNGGKSTTGTPAALTQADIDRAVAKAVADNNTARDANEKGLASTKDSLLKQNKEYKDKIRDNDLKQRMLDGDVEKVTKEIEARVKKENADKLTEKDSEIAKLKTKDHNKTIESFIDSLNDGCGIMSELKNAWKLELLSKAAITTDEKGDILINGKNQQEFISDWLENGQNVDTWRAAKPSNGGGAQGGKSTGTSSGHAETLSKLSSGEMFAKASELQNKLT